jgi:hypothetical protein
MPRSCRSRNNGATCRHRVGAPVRATSLRALAIDRPRVERTRAQARGDQQRAPPGPQPGHRFRHTQAEHRQHVQPMPLGGGRRPVADTPLAEQPALATRRRDRATRRHATHGVAERTAPQLLHRIGPFPEGHRQPRRGRIVGLVAGVHGPQYVPAPHGVLQAPSRHEPTSLQRRESVPSNAGPARPGRGPTRTRAERHRDPARLRARDHHQHAGRDGRRLRATCSRATACSTARRAAPRRAASATPPTSTATRSAHSRRG